VQKFSKYNSGDSLGENVVWETDELIIHLFKGIHKSKSILNIKK